MTSFDTVMQSFRGPVAMNDDSHSKQQQQQQQNLKFPKQSQRE
jgi:hypothetical protein